MLILIVINLICQIGQGSSLKSSKTQANKEYRLPIEFTPKEYDLTITPYFEGEKKFTFDGHVIIGISQMKEDLKRIVLHSKHLTIHKVIVKEKEKVLETDGEIKYDLLHDYMIINLKNKLSRTLSYEVDIAYSGIMNDGMTGFHRSSYVEDEKIKWLGNTQFQPVHARSAFPCFDEPSFKAKFKVTIIRSKSFQTSLSNMQLETSTGITINEVTLMKDQFYQTPSMSTYLLAFIVSEFIPAESNNDTKKEFRVYARPQAIKMGKLAFDMGQELVAKMDDYLKIKYYEMDPHIKMDQAAIPDFSMYAMENWGLLTYREIYLMYDENESSAKYKQQVVATLAHEIAHMWFGNLVTCHWWSDTWLNEGFARFFQYLLPDMIDDLDMRTQYVLTQVHTAFQADKSASSVPLTNNNVYTPAEVMGQFGTISYNKGSAIIRMMQHWIGISAFKEALNLYLKAREYKTSAPKYLFNALQNMSDLHNSLADYVGSSVKDVMSSWTTNAGYPLVNVNIDYDSGDMTISQERFLMYGEAPSKTVYQIPISFATASRPFFNDTKPNFIMKTKEVIKNKGRKGSEWVVFNKQQTGYYRVNYDIRSWMILTNTLNSKNRIKINTLNRAQIVDDTFNLAREKKISYSLMFTIIQFLEFETDYAPWTAAYSGFSFLRQRFSKNLKILNKINLHLNKLMENVVKNVGLSERTEDSHLQKLFRASTLSLACQLGHQKCIDESIRLFTELKVNSTRINPNLREHVYCNALRHGSESDFTVLWDMHTKQNVVNDKIVILGALGCTSKAKSIKKYLELTMNPDSGIRKRDIMSAFNSVLLGNKENIEVVFLFVRNNLPRMRKYYKSSNIKIIFNYMAARMSNGQLERFSDYLKTVKNMLRNNEYETGISAIQNSREDYRWAQRNAVYLETWLDEKYNEAGALSISLVLFFTTLATVFSTR